MGIRFGQVIRRGEVDRGQRLHGTAATERRLGGATCQPGEEPCQLLLYRRNPTLSRTLAVRPEYGNRAVAPGARIGAAI